MDLVSLETEIFSLPSGGTGFDALLERVLRYQQEKNPVYNRYCNELVEVVHPLLPIAAFKHAPVCTFPPEEAERVFESSGTGRGTRSRHFVRSLKTYEASFKSHFEALMGKGPLTLVAHLPHYSERGETSSLLYMVGRLIEHLGDVASGFFLEDTALLRKAIAHATEQEASFVLFGAAFGLLDLVERQQWALPAGAVVIETGGMKTYRREITRSDLHHQLASGFGVPANQIWSEYGMCELLSQAYAKGGSLFQPPPWMRFVVMDIENPLQQVPDGEPGILGVYDLANLHSVSAI